MRLAIYFHCSRTLGKHSCHLISLCGKLMEKSWWDRDKSVFQLLLSSQGTNSVAWGYGSGWQNCVFSLNPCFSDVCPWEVTWCGTCAHWCGHWVLCGEGELVRSLRMSSERWGLLLFPYWPPILQTAEDAKDFFKRKIDFLTKQMEKIQPAVQEKHAMKQGQFCKTLSMIVCLSVMSLGGGGEAHECHGTCVEVGGKFSGIGFLLSSWVLDIKLLSSGFVASDSSC